MIPPAGAVGFLTAQAGGPGSTAGGPRLRVRRVSRGCPTQAGGGHGRLLSSTVPAADRRPSPDGPRPRRRARDALDVGDYSIVPRRGPLPGANRGLPGGAVPGPGVVFSNCTLQSLTSVIGADFS